MNTQTAMIPPSWLLTVMMQNQEKPAATLTGPPLHCIRCGGSDHLENCLNEDAEKHFHHQGSKADTPSPSKPNPNEDKVSKSELPAKMPDSWTKTLAPGMIRRSVKAQQCGENTKMCCDHGEAFKDHQHHNLVGPPLDYMKTCRVFKATKTNAYDFCHFYRVSATRELPVFPTPCDPASSDMLKGLLEASQTEKCANLLMVFAGESTTTVCLLQALHDEDSMKCLTLDMKPGKQDTDSKLVRKLSFCPFCLYQGSNDLSYVSHIVFTHYNMAYGCDKCLKAVLLMGQQLKSHLKTCTGFPKDDTASLSDWEPALPATRESLHYLIKCLKNAKSDSAKESTSHIEEFSQRAQEVPQKVQGLG